MYFLACGQPHCSGLGHVPLLHTHQTFQRSIIEFPGNVHSENKVPRHLTTTITIQETRTREGGPVASTATKELDDLMASLSDFKVSAGKFRTGTTADYLINNYLYTIDSIWNTLNKFKLCNILITRECGVVLTSERL
jgi:hypothetical protein